MMAVPKRWLALSRIPIALVGVALFFHGYNRFILNASLQNLKTSLNVLNATSGVGQAEAALLLVDQAVLNQMVSAEMDLEALTTLQYAHGTLSTDALERPVKDVQMVLDTLAEGQALKRPGILTAADGVVTTLQGAFKQAALLPNRIFRGNLSPEIDSERLQKAIRTERMGLFSEALQMYRGLLKSYPRYAGRTGLKLRAAHLAERLNSPDEAWRFYREVLRQTDKTEEAAAAEQALERLRLAQKKKREVKILEERLQKTPIGLERQRSAFELGGILIQIQAFEKAAEVFRQAHLADPKGELAPISKFKGGWCLRSSGQLEEAFKTFAALVQQDPKSPWALASYSQIAEIYKATGDLASAAKIYEEQLAKSTDDALTAAVLLQTGSTYLFDLNNPRKAQVYFDMLTLNFPASPFSSKGQAIFQTQAPEAASPSQRAPPRPSAPAVSTPVTKPEEPFLPAPGAALSENAPVMTWLSEFLPIFVDVFVDKLAQYMQLTGSKELTRRYTEEEFRELVVRRVQERFPGKFRDVVAKIRPDGFLGSGTLRLGSETFSIRARVGIVVVAERPHALIREVKVGNLTLPDPLLRTLEKRVNASIDQGDYPLRIKKYDLKEGHALITVELDTLDPQQTTTSSKELLG